MRIERASRKTYFLNAQIVVVFELVSEAFSRIVMKLLEILRSFVQFLNEAWTVVRQVQLDRLR